MAWLQSKEGLEPSLDGPPRLKRGDQLVGCRELSQQDGLLSHQVSIHLLELNDDVRLGINLHQGLEGGLLRDG